MSPDAALAYLNEHHNREAVAGSFEDCSLDLIQQLLATMGDPHRVAPAIHITGTNGKGSVAHLCASLLHAHGLRVGLYTSPHQTVVNERIRLDLEPISDVDLAVALSDVAAVEALVDGVPSWFEVMTAAAFAAFSTAAVDVMVIEVGLLGRFDATNVVEAGVAVVTNIGRDHTDGAPGWAHRIAEEKAGIIHPGSTVVLGAMEADLQEIFRREEADQVLCEGVEFEVELDAPAVGGRGFDLRTVHGHYQHCFLPLHGSHQASNAAVAVVAVESFFGRALDDEVVRAGLENVVLPGRFDIVHRHPLVVLDGAHNPDGFEVLANTIAELLLTGRRIFVLGLLSGRDPQDMFEAIGLSGDDLVVACTPPNPRAIRAEVLTDAALTAGIEAENGGSVANALERALALAGEEDIVVVCGSTYLLAPARDFLELRGET